MPGTGYAAPDDRCRAHLLLVLSHLRAREPVLEPAPWVLGPTRGAFRPAGDRDTQGGDMTCAQCEMSPGGTLRCHFVFLAVSYLIVEKLEELQQEKQRTLVEWPGVSPSQTLWNGSEW